MTWHLTENEAAILFSEIMTQSFLKYFVGQTNQEICHLLYEHLPILYYYCYLTVNSLLDDEHRNWRELWKVHPNLYYIILNLYILIMFRIEYRDTVREMALGWYNHCASGYETYFYHLPKCDTSTSWEQWLICIMRKHFKLG